MRGPASSDVYALTHAHTPVATADIDSECLCHMEIDSVSLPFFPLLLSVFSSRFFPFLSAAPLFTSQSMRTFFLYFIALDYVHGMDRTIYRRMSFIPSIYAFIMQYACIVLPFHNAQKSYYVWKWCTLQEEMW